MTSHSELGKMASTTVQSALGGYLNVFAVAGVAAVSYVSVKLVLSILNGIKVFFLSGPLGLSINLRKTGEWAGELLEREGYWVNIGIGHV